MNYPIWDVPASGLFIAGIAILHVFISHFAVGGGAFLVLYEMKALRENDSALLGYVRCHSRFFLLLTLVLGAVTGVGIWFTIGLVHPQATSTLIQTFVWIWALEWVFFLTEIVAAMVYFYGWDRMDSRLHLAVGWIYFGSAWMSMIIINGILTFMLTPGEWLTTRSLVDAFFNPTYWPGLLIRSLVAMGLAGIYAFLTAAFLRDKKLGSSVIRYAALWWLLPAFVLLVPSVAWFLSAAGGAGIPVAEILGADDSSFSGIMAALSSGGASTGYPVAQTAGLVLVVCSGLLLIGTGLFGAWKPRLLSPAVAVAFMICGICAFGAGEFIREDLRKPFVLGGNMFVNGLRLPVSRQLLENRPEYEKSDPFSLDVVYERGILASANWTLDSLSAPSDQQSLEGETAQGREIFRLMCSGCHTIDGHLAIRPLVAGKPAASLVTLIEKLAEPVDGDGEPAEWNAESLRLRTWRGRRMPPFVGTGQERAALAAYLTSLSGMPKAVSGEAIVMPESDALAMGREQFEGKCIFCHGDEADWAMRRLAPGRDAEAFYERIGRLPEVNPIMPPFEGSDEERHALADYLAHFVTEQGEVTQ